jgi:predicted DNA-binding transcriptional regulator AlpA
MIGSDRTGEALLTEIEAAKILRLSTRTLQAWRIKAVGPSFVRAGRAVRYRRPDILAWVDANTVHTHRISHTANGVG